MKNLIKKAKYVMTGEEGSSNIEIIIWISVVLVIATVLIVFSGQIKGFLTKAGGKVDALKVA